MAELTEKIDIKSMLPEELAEFLRSLGQPAYREKQLFRWFSAGCGSWDEMTNLPRALRQELSERCTLSAPRVLKKQQSAEDGTINQKTEDLIGPYELHDFFLYHFIKYGAEPEKIRFLAEAAFEGSYPAELIDRTLATFLRRFFQQQFKRNCIPDGPKVGTISLSPRGDWRMPADASFAAWR